MKLAHVNTAPSWSSCVSAKAALNAEIAANGKHSAAAQTLANAYCAALEVCMKELGYPIKDGIC